MNRLTTAAHDALFDGVRENVKNLFTVYTHALAVKDSDARQRFKSGLELNRDAAVETIMMIDEVFPE